MFFLAVFQPCIANDPDPGDRLLSCMVYEVSGLISAVQAFRPRYTSPVAAGQDRRKGGTVWVLMK